MLIKNKYISYIIISTNDVRKSSLFFFELPIAKLCSEEFVSFDLLFIFKFCFLGSP